MAFATLTTKLHIPPAPEILVRRPGLVSRLVEGLRGPLVLISAPAGYGKSSLVSEWRSSVGANYPLAWITLDADDNDSLHFFYYFAAAIQSLEPGFGEAILNSLSSPQPPHPKITLNSLINELDQGKQSFALVLDDYHVITERSIHESLNYLLEHLPHRMHLVILTRADPPLNLPRMRVRGHLTEIRQANLRFSLDEADAYLNQVMKLGLTPEDVDKLAQRTEGWIAGLQLAAISMLGNVDKRQFIAAFSGSHHYIMDFLVEEVLNRQTQLIKDFLLDTSILEQMNGDICKELTGLKDTQAVLDQLEHANLFLIPLDDQQCWYRYHQLFAEVLQNRLRQSHPEAIRDLHLRAAQWYKLNAMISPAVVHAFAALDFELTASIVEQYFTPMQRRGEFRTLSGWLNRLPEDVVRTKPQLCISYAWALAFSWGKPEAVERYLQFAEQAIQATPSSPQAQDMSGQIAVIRANKAVFLGDNKRAIELTNQAQKQLMAGNTSLRGYNALVQADAYWMMGDGMAAQQALEKAIQLCKDSNDLLTVLTSMNYLARVQVAHGLLRRALDTYQSALSLANEMGGQQWPAAGVIYVGLGMLLWEKNEAQSAVQHLKKGIELASQAGDVDSLLFGYTALARIYQARGDKEREQEMIRVAERTVQETSLARDRYRLAARQARMKLNMGDIESAAQWSAELTRSVEEYSQSSPLPVISPMRVSAEVVKARVLIAQSKLDEAVLLLSGLIKPLESAGRMRSVIELLILNAMALQAQGELEPALTALSFAVTLAEPEGFVRLFVDEGQPMSQLLQRIRVEDKGLSGYITHLLKAYQPLEIEPQTVKTRLGKSTESPWIEPLTDRELDVLRLIATGCSNKEIADRLVIAIGTVKRHTANIFSKLDVRNRTEAVARARDLKLM